MKAAQKAVKTSKARKVLRERFGDLTFYVVMDLLKDRTDTVIMDWNGISRESLAAYKANLTRGSYDSWLRGCNF